MDHQPTTRVITWGWPLTCWLYMAHDNCLCEHQLNVDSMLAHRLQWRTSIKTALDYHGGLTNMRQQHKAVSCFSEKKDFQHCGEPSWLRGSVLNVGPSSTASSHHLNFIGPASGVSNHPTNTRKYIWSTPAALALRYHLHQTMWPVLTSCDLTWPLISVYTPSQHVPQVHTGKVNITWLHHGHLSPRVNTHSAGADYRRQNLTSLVVRFWRR